MADRIFRTDRRELMAGLGAAALVRRWPRPATARGAQVAGCCSQSRCTSPCVRESRIRRYGRSGASRPGSPLQARRQAGNYASRTNCPYRSVLNWRGIDGAPAAEPLLARAPAGAGCQGKPCDSIASCRHVHVRPPAAGRRRRRGHRRRVPLVVGESEPVAVDRDEMFLIEDWRLRAGRNRDRARTRPTGHASRLYTVNGLNSLDITARINERLGSASSMAANALSSL